jgi:hypothetical protein
MSVGSNAPAPLFRSSIAPRTRPPEAIGAQSADRVAYPTASETSR